MSAKWQKVTKEKEALDEVGSDEKLPFSQAPDPKFWSWKTERFVWISYQAWGLSRTWKYTRGKLQCLAYCK